MGVTIPYMSVWEKPTVVLAQGYIHIWESLFMIQGIGISIRDERVQSRHTSGWPYGFPYVEKDKKHSSEKIKSETDLKTWELSNFTTAGNRSAHWLEIVEHINPITDWPLSCIRTMVLVNQS